MISITKSEKLIKEDFSHKSDGLFRYTNFFTDSELKFVEDKVKEVIKLGESGKLINNDITYNKTSKRTQLNMGFYYSYGFDREASILSKASKNGEIFTRTTAKGVQPVQMERNLYGKEVAVPVEPMTKWLNDLTNKMVISGIISEEDKYNSALINLYPPGGSIFPHVDDFPSFERNIATVRLFAPTVMSFGYTGADTLQNAIKGKKTFRVNLPVGSIVVMKGYTATKITHAIMQEDVKETTVSITLRKLRPDYLPNEYKSYENNEM